MGSYRTLIDTNRSAVRVLGAAHECPELGGFRSGSALRPTADQKLPLVLEPPG